MKRMLKAAAALGMAIAMVGGPAMAQGGPPSHSNIENACGGGETVMTNPGQHRGIDHAASKDHPKHDPAPANPRALEFFEEHCS